MKHPPMQRVIHGNNNKSVSNQLSNSKFLFLLFLSTFPFISRSLVPKVLPLVSNSRSDSVCIRGGPASEFLQKSIYPNFNLVTEKLLDAPFLSRKAVPAMRAWTCHGRTHREMVEKLASSSLIKSTTVKEAFLRVDRSNYAAQKDGAYNDAPQPIGYGQTISAPHMHAHVLEELLPVLTRASAEIKQHHVLNPDGHSSQEGEELKVLDVGSGSGFLTAAFGRLVDRGTQGPITPLVKGKVYGIDVYPELVNFALSNMKKADQDLLDSETVSIQVGDGWRGLPDVAPFHAIHVGAAAASFPQNLMMQLHPRGGIMIVPIGPNGGTQNLYRVERMRERNTFHKDDFDVRALFGVRYVPLLRP